MNAYIYKAALWCEDCIAKIKAGEEGYPPLTLPAGADIDNEHTYDSDQYPKGPYGDGGGEADCAQHCDGCRCHLENPLTQDGACHVFGKLTEGEGDLAVLQTWLDYYGSDLNMSIEDWRDATKELLEDVAAAIENKTKMDDESRARILFRCKALGQL